MRTLVGLLLIAAAGDDELARAKEKVRALNYPAALQALTAAESAEGATDEQLWQVYELEGTVLATLKRPQESVERFERMLALRPDHRFSTPRAPRVMTPYYEARDWLKRHAPLAITLKVERDQAATATVDLSITDALGWVQQLDVEVTEDGASRSLHFPKDQWPPPAITSHAKSIQIAATAIGAHHQQLARATAVNEAPEPKPTLTPVTAARASDAPAPEAIVAPVEVRRSSGTLRVVGIISLGVAVAAGALGAYFGAISRQDTNTFNAAVSTFMMTGQSPLSPSQAASLSSDKQRDAWGANVLFGTAAVLALVGLALVIFGGPSS